MGWDVLFHFAARYSGSHAQPLRIRENAWAITVEIKEIVSDKGNGPAVIYRARPPRSGLFWGVLSCANLSAEVAQSPADHLSDGHLQGFVLSMQFYILYANLPVPWTDIYHQKFNIAGLNYIFVSVISDFTVEISTGLIGCTQKKLSAEHNGNHKPQFRMTCRPQPLPWWQACSFMDGARIFTSIGSCPMSGNFTSAAMTWLHLPDRRPNLRSALGYDRGSSVLGFIKLGLELPAVILLWKSGETLRERRPYVTALDFLQMHTLT